MRRAIGLLAACVMTAAVSAACSASPSAGGPGWATPDDVLAGIREAGFACVLPSSDTIGQVLTTDPITGEDLAGNSLVRCPDFQVMLAATTVEEGFAALVICQDVSADIRASAEWSSAIVVGPDFVILPADLSRGWAAGAQTGEMTKAFGGTVTTFGEMYDRSCKATSSTGPASAAPSASAS